MGDKIWTGNPISGRMIAMHFDAITLACVVTELNQSIRSGRVQQLVQVDEHSFGFEIYAERERRHLLISANPAKPRIHLVSQKLRRGVNVETPLLLLLRKYVRGARVDAIEQRDATERVARIRFDHSEHGETELVIELIGRASNLLLLGPNNTIFDCLRRVRGRAEHDRDLLPRRDYRTPPLQDKLSPLDSNKSVHPQELIAEQLANLLSTDEPLWKTLVSNTAGVSPTLAREIAWRASTTLDGGSDINVLANQVDPTTVASVLHTIWARVQQQNWQPSLLYKNDAIAGFAPYPLHFGEMAPAGAPASITIHSALEDYYARAAGAGNERDSVNATGTTDPYAAQRSNVAALIRRSRKQVSRRLKAVEADQPKPGEADNLRTQAEWILALSHQIEPGQTRVEVPLATEESESQQIQLDPSKTPVEYAQGLFKRAGKLERAAKILPARKAKLSTDLKFLDQLASDLQLAENQPEIAAVQTELQEAGLLGHQQGKNRPRKNAPKSGAKTSKPRRYISPDGVAILVGRNARQNDKVTFDHAKPDDLWLHVRAAPGSHVVIRSGGQPVSEETLHMAAQLAAYYSNRRGERAATVAVTQRRNVTRVPKGRAGQVYMRNEETVTVPAELPADLMISDEREKRSGD